MQAATLGTIVEELFADERAKELEWFRRAMAGEDGIETLRPQAEEAPRHRTPLSSRAILPYLVPTEVPLLPTPRAVRTEPPPAPPQGGFTRLFLLGVIALLLVVLAALITMIALKAI